LIIIIIIIISKHYLCYDLRSCRNGLG